MLRARYKGRIIKVGSDQSNPYILVFCEDNINETVYVPLEKGWKSEIPPTKDMIVFVEDVYLSNQGWRARSSRPFTPEDQHAVDAELTV